MDIDAIIPYADNARNNEAAIPYVAESISEFGLRGQIVLESRENPVIVAGHTRWAACKSLGWTEIPDERIDFCDGLTPDQIMAYRLADNKTGEIATWNKALEKREVRKLEGRGFDMSRFRFDFKSRMRPYGAERMKTVDAYNLDIVSAVDCDDDGMPTINPCDEVPGGLLPFNYAKTNEDTEKWIHFFVDDYQFERLWNRPRAYLDLIKRFDGALTPDFSLYMDMPLPMQRWNEYRRRALGNWWQRNGVSVIPTLSWSDERSYGFCFGGLPRGATYAVSTVGVKGDDAAMGAWKAGMAEAVRRLEPRRVLLYGGGIGFDFPCEVVEYPVNTSFKG